MNKVIEIGRLTKDPELRYTQNNTPVCSFTIAVDRFSKAGEEKQADFFPIVAWNNTAEFCNKYFSKGRKVAVSGRLQNRSWEDTEGKKHYITEIVADEVDFADSKKDGASDPNGAPEQNYQQGRPAANKPSTPPPPAGIANAGQGKLPWEQGG